MLKSHVKFNSVSGKRQILIVDDEKVNRDLLGLITGQDFDPIYAENGEEAVKLIRMYGDLLSIILLDLKMPVMDGFEVMRILRKDEELSRIPIIVLTSDDSAEVESLQLGASDFILKPFSMPEVIIARIQKTIELFEDRHIIQSTEREDMTGLFNKEYFYSYASRFDKFHKELEMDAAALDINHFHLINELYGRQTGDEVLKHLADYLKELREKTGCMASRVEGDKFLVYIPHGSVDYIHVSEEINSHFANFKDIAVRVRMGVYIAADKEIDIERRFDRAVRAANTLKANYSSPVAYYDAAIHEKKMFEERLLNEIDDAIKENQFYLDYQPKYNVEGEVPRLSSAEALVRWKHPSLGPISPGLFVPLLEKNGLIHKLDCHVWEMAVSAAARWGKEYGIEIPVSVNISRMDLYTHDLAEFLEETLVKYGVASRNMYIEITESAYADDSEQILDMIRKLRTKGFKIEMDDFGSGYSSLNMLAEMPIDVLKLDMRFVRNLRSDERRETLIKLVMDIAKCLSLTVVAEGVEDKGQVDFLRSVGCEVIQGYYFSKPLSEENFIALVKEDAGC